MQKKEIILGMDHNLDLLKSNTHGETQSFLDLNFENSIFPCITRPTRITNTSATLIDNIFIRQNLHKSFDACVIIHDISDQLPSLINIHDQMHSNNNTLEFACRSLNKERIALVNDLVLSSDWSTLNKCDVNIAYKEYQNIIDKCLDAVAPIKQIKILGHRVWCKPWITKGLSRSMEKCIKLYRLSIGSNTMPETENKYCVSRKLVCGPLLVQTQEMQLLSLYIKIY